jgi:dUTP pyrophosphatase
VPQGYYARIAPRSGLAIKYGIDVFAGVVDAGYRGEVKVILMNASDKIFKVDVGDKIAQLIIQPCESWSPIEVATLDDLGDTERGTKGFGSSGN